MERPENPVAFASGRVGNTVWSHNQYGQYTRPATTPTDPNTTPQQLMRAILTSWSQQWGLGLTESQREGWRAYARAKPVRDRFGRERYLTGANWFVRINSVRSLISTGLKAISQIWNAPPIDEQPTVTPTTHVVQASNRMRINHVTAFAQWGQENDAAMAVYASPSMPLTRTFHATPFHFIGAAYGGFPPVRFFTTLVVQPQWTVGLRTWVHTRVVRASGTMSERYISVSPAIPTT